MPLPTDPATEWPPPEVGPALRAYAEWSAWWSGNPDALSAANASTMGTGLADGISATARPGQGSTLLAGLKRRFWGVPPPSGQLRSAKLHIPLPADIAATSSALLFATPPRLDAGEDADKTQERLDDYLDDGGLASVLLEGGEIASAYGGVYVRVGWDPEVAGMPLWDVITPDHAVPEFRSGWLTAVTFWRQVGEQKGKILRHLERHEKGRILHGLYEGSTEKLGSPIDLRAHPTTEPFYALVGAAGFVETGAPEGLTVEYVPNMRPSRALRGTHLGRSDYDGVEGLFDALDEVYTSLLRDVRIGKGRITVPSVYLQSRGRGKGAMWDPEQEVYEGLEALGGGDGLHLQVVQFAIRVAEHVQTGQELTDKAVRAAGYSPQTFGATGDVAATATEVVARQLATMQTRGRKIGYWRPRLRRLAHVALLIDVKHFGPDGVKPDLPGVEWPDAVEADPEATARTLQMLRAAELISIRGGVERLNPDWEDDDVDAEVARIVEDRGDPAPDPGMGFGPDMDPGSAGAPTSAAVVAAAPAGPVKPANAGPVNGRPLPGRMPAGR